MTTEYQVRGMGCNGCVQAVTQALQQVPGVQQAEVTLDPPLATITSDKMIAIEKLRAAAKDAGGYDIEEPAIGR